MCIGSTYAPISVGEKSLSNMYATAPPEGIVSPEWMWTQGSTPCLAPSLAIGASCAFHFVDARGQCAELLIAIVTELHAIDALLGRGGQ